MNKRLKFLLVFLMAALVLSVPGCSTEKKQGEKDLMNTEEGVLLFKEDVSPNKEYVESDADVVYYTIEVYQNEENYIIVNADSNSEFFDRMQYVLEYDKKISEKDISVEWTTITGNPEPTKDDQIAVAKVSISDDSEIISERKINFFRKGMEIIVDNINQQK